MFFMVDFMDPFACLIIMAVCRFYAAIFVMLRV